MQFLLSAAAPPEGFEGSLLLEALQLGSSLFDVVRSNEAVKDSGKSPTVADHNQGWDR